MLLFTNRVIINRCINAPGHGRSKIYGIIGSYKAYLRQIILIIGTEESNNENKRMNETPMICEKNKEFKYNFIF